MSLFSSPPPELFAAAAATASTTATPARMVDPADHPPLRGRGLRWVLLDELKRHTQLTVAAMARILADHGFDLGPGRASKLISLPPVLAGPQTRRHPDPTYQPTLDRLRLALEHVTGTGRRALSAGAAARG